MSRAITSLVVLFLVLSNAPARGEANEWPQFRGPTGQGISEAKNVPVEWGPEKNVAWRVELPGKGWSSPVLSKGKVYLTSATGGKDKPVLHALCLDAASGKVAWDAEVFTPASGGGMHGKNSLASATPIVTADRLYVHFGHMGTAALDLAGNVVWRQTSLKYSPVHGNGGSPILVNGDTLIFGCDGASNPFLAALDAGTGEVKWKTPRNGTTRKNFSFSTATLIEVDGKQEVISPASSFVGAYDPADGKEIWRVRYGDGYSVVPRPVYADGLLFLSSGFDAPVLYAINPKGASGDVTGSHVAWTARKGAPNTPSAVCVGDEVYFVSDGGIATCADAKSGKAHWTHRLPGGYSASPVVAEGRIYFQNEAGLGTVIKAGKAFEQVAANDLEEATLASYAVGEGALFIRTETRLYRVGK